MKEKLLKNYNNYNSNLNYCSGLTLISSESCNLNCSYCVMAKSIHKEKTIHENEKIKESFNNGTYFNNVKQIYEKYNLDPNLITFIDLWGQEPTLTLNEFGNSFKNFYEYFPNINSLFFSTNGVAFPDRIISLAKKIDQIVKPNFEFNFQVSYDGYELTKNYRGINPKIILNNIEYLLLELNKINFNNIKIRFCNHCVINKDIVNKYGNSNKYDQEFFNYLKELSDLSIYYQSLVNNPKLNYILFIPGLENPWDATAKEGQNLTEFFIKAEKLGKDLEHKWWRSVFDQFIFYEPQLLHEPINIYSHLLYGFNNKDKIIPYTGCGFNCGNLKIRYDGKILHCQNAIAVLSPDNTNDLHSDIIFTLKENNYIPNILEESQKLEVEKSLLRGAIYHRASRPFILSEIINLMLLLSKYNQIHPSYKDEPDKFFRHAVYISQILNCWDNYLTTTGSGFHKIIGEIRLYCNGYLDLIDIEKKAREEKECQ